ncbi:hypothetical protein L7F22_031639 [Adiantum nelumboides]|nr:hypothetical protein [Adiantum nelumboides]
MEDEEDDDDDDNEDQQIEGISIQDHGPDVDDNQDDPPNGIGPSTGGATREPSNPPASQPEPPPPAPKGGKQEEMSIAGPGGGSQKEMVGHEGVGYAIVLGYGAFFAILTIVISILDNRYGGAKNTSEEFNTAGRSIKTGLVAVDVVSHWTWVSTLLQSANETFTNGISGSFWYATSSAVQILLFGIVAMEIKRRAPKAHTVVELVRRRWGNSASIVIFPNISNAIFTFFTELERVLLMACINQQRCTC